LTRFVFARFILCAPSIAVSSLHAQDTRVVGEPAFPATCAVLKATLHATDNALAAADEVHLDTQRIQAALDGCTPGKAVQLSATAKDNAFLSGPLELRTGVTLLVDHGVTLYASRNPRDFDTQPNSCGISGPDSRPCKPLISVSSVKDAAVMGDGVIDGRGDRGVLGKPYTWWQQSRAAEPGNVRYSAPRLIVANHADGLILYRIRLHNAPNFHVTINNTNGFTAWGVHLLTPTVRGTDARNTDGIDPGSSQNITITKSWIDNGDDNIAIKADVHNMSVLDNHFYSGHGMSIGSEARGEDHIIVDKLTLDHTTSGIRIKSNVQRGGLVQHVTYRNVCMRNSPVPISISPFYTGTTADGIVDTGLKGERTPEYRDILLENVISTTPGIVQVAGLNAELPTQITFDGVLIRGIEPGQAKAQYTHVALGPKGTNFTLAGKDVTTSPPSVPAKPTLSCEGVFVPYQD
jgi:polygalacturonase